VGESPFFLWAHLYDAHRPYDPPEPFASRHASDPYVGEIAYADAQIGRLVQALERRQRLDRTIVIVAGDHGESLGEHGERDHGILIYENVVRVPLIVRIPGAAPGRIHSVVRLIDVMPTVLELLRLPIPRIDGVSLMELMSGGGEEREAYSESEYPRRLGWSPLRALRDGRFKVIDAPRPELYDLQDDPYEERNLYHERRRTAEALMRRLRVVAAGSSGSPSQAAPSEMVSDEVRDRLAALGYVTTTPSPHPHPSALIDPKDALAKGEHPWDRR
jgi:arylsulfatase A-like enzyme